MKTNIRGLMAILTLATLLLALPPAWAGGVGSMDMGITNASLAASTGATALGQSTASIDQQDNVLLVFTGTSRATNASNTTLGIARTDADGNIETWPKFIWTIPQYTLTDASTVTTNTFVSMTNLTRDWIGGAAGLAVIGVTNGSAAGALTSPTLKVVKKRLQAPN